MEPVDEADPWDRLLELAEAGDEAELGRFFSSLEPSEAVRAILRLEPDHQEMVLTGLNPSDAADLIEDLPDEQAADIIESMEPVDAAEIVMEMQSDEQADLIADLNDEDAEAILQEMKPEEADEARSLASYADNVAGGLMITEYFRFEESVSVGDAMDEIQTRSEELDEYFSRYAYVVSGWGRLVGVLEVRDLVLCPREKPIADIMAPSLFAKAQAPLDELKNFFENREFAAVPIVDTHGRLVGVVRSTSVQSALAKRSEQEMMRMYGIVGGDEIRNLPTLTRSRRRLSWLSVNIVLNIAAASVIALYIDTLGAVIALAVFLPIISDMSGCSGNQAVAVSMRELSLGIVKPFEVFRVWLKEISVGALNGIALGLILGFVAWAWKGNPYLGLVIGGALMVNTLVAVSIGGTVPLLLKRFGVDPAVASGPILTTVTDICGFFLVLSFATMLLPKLL
ncbi:MAG: magnesium transporter [Rhodospirillales bacterium]|nr:magnesium transporter [Rhodospirillales bacterium]